MVVDVLVWWKENPGTAQLFLGVKVSLTLALHPCYGGHPCHLYLHHFVLGRTSILPQQHPVDEVPVVPKSNLITIYCLN